MSAITFDELVSEVAKSEGGTEVTPCQSETPTRLRSTLPHWLPALVDFSKATEVGHRPVNFVVKDLLVAGRAANLTGMGGSSKTTLLIMMALQVALDIDHLGWNVERPGHAVLVLAEETEEDVQRFVAALLNHLGLTEEGKQRLMARLHIHAAAGYSCRLVDKSQPEQTQERLHGLIAHCQAIGNVSFIGLDPAIALSGGRELDELDQRELALAVDRLAIATGAAVVLVSHASKAVQYQSEIGSHYSRGSGALTDALRLEMLMRVMTSKEAKKLRIPESDRNRYVRFQVTKANRLPPQAMNPKWFERKDAGILWPVTFQGSLLANGDELRAPVEVLQVFLGSNPSTGELKPQTHRFASIKARLIERRHVASSSLSGEEMAARRLLQRLQKEGLAEALGQGFWKLTKKGEEAALQREGDALSDDRLDTDEEMNE